MTDGLFPEISGSHQENSGRGERGGDPESQRRHGACKDDDADGDKDHLGAHEGSHERDIAQANGKKCQPSAEEKGDRHQDGMENEVPMNLTSFEKKKRREDQADGKIGQMKRLRHGDAFAQSSLDEERAERVERGGGEGKQEIPRHEGPTIRDTWSKESES